MLEINAPKLVKIKAGKDREPRRDPECDRYDLCLKTAAKAARSFSCIHCPLWNPVDRRPDPLEVRGCAALVAEILGPKYKRGLLELFKGATRSPL
jgi:hypothetical protein